MGEFEIEKFTRVFGKLNKAMLTPSPAPANLRNSLRPSTLWQGGRVSTTREVDEYGRTVTVNVGEGRVVETRQGRNSHVIGVKEGQSKFIEERYVGERVVNVTTHALEERIISSKRPEARRSVRAVETWEDEPIIQERIVEKEVEVIVEKKVPVERYVDVEYEVVSRADVAHFLPARSWRDLSRRSLRRRSRSRRSWSAKWRRSSR